MLELMLFTDAYVVCVMGSSEQRLVGVEILHGRVTRVLA
jgi:hypothetical protein